MNRPGYLENFTESGGAMLDPEERETAASCEACRIDAEDLACTCERYGWHGEGHCLNCALAETGQDTTDTTAGFTPGPWYASPGCGGQGLIISEVDGASIAVAYDARDARLIAAAPEMFELLEDAAGWLRWMAEYWPADLVKKSERAEYADEKRRAIRKLDGMIREFKHKIRNA